MIEGCLLRIYSSAGFFPDTLIVEKDIPVKIYVTRVYGEHVNRLSFEPFVSATDLILPDRVVTIEFTPDKVGEFKILNLGHGSAGTLIVVKNREELKKKMVAKGLQEIALIPSPDDQRIYPSRIEVQLGVPLKIYAMSAATEHLLSIDPFYLSTENNVRPQVVATIDLVPDKVGEFAISDELYQLEGMLVVEES